MNRSITACLGPWMLVAIWLVSSATKAHAAPIAIAYAGIEAPGTGGKKFRNSALPYMPIADGDSVVFEHNTTDAKYGLWRWQNGALSKVIYSGEPIPGVPGQTFSSPFEFTVNDAGRVAFSTFYGVTIETPSGLHTVAKRNDPTPGDATYKFNSFSDLAFSADGQVSFRAQISGGASRYGVWRASPTGIHTVAVDEQSLQGGDTISDTYSFAPPAVGNGATTLAASLNPDDRYALIRQTSSAETQVVALRGQPAPGLITEVFSSFQDVAGSDAGHLAFRASLSGGPVFNAIFRDMGSGPSFVVGNRSPMPGPPGAQLAGLSDPIINEAGVIGMSGYLSGGASGLWLIDTSNVIHEIVREKYAVPGLPGAQFGSFIGVNFQMNDSDQIAWLGSIQGPGINFSNDKGIWATDPAGNIISIVREGQLVEVSPGVFRTVQSIAFSDSSYFNGAISAWTDNQMLVYTLTFTDSTSGIFVSSVPEPGGMALLAVAALVGLATRARHRARAHHRFAVGAWRAAAFVVGAIAGIRHAKA